MKRLLLFLLLCHAVGASALDSVRLQLKWKHQFQFAGYYAAVEKGYYRQAGLDVTLAEAGAGTNVIDEVVSGRAQFGVGTSELVLIRQRQPVVAMAVIMQHSPLVLLARGRKIFSVHDLAGRKVMIEPHSAELFAYLRREGIPEHKLDIVPHSFSPRALESGDIAAISAYWTTEPYQLQKARVPYLTLNPRSAGIDFYGDNLFTVERELHNKPARAKAFLAASLRGWEYAMAHPEEMIDIILERYNSQGLDREFLRFEAAEMARLMQVDLVQVGQMNPGRWRHIADTYAGLGMLPRDAPLDGLLYDDTVRPMPDWVLPAAIVGGIMVTLFGVLATLSIGLSRRLQREAAEHREASRQLNLANGELQRQLAEINELQQMLKEQAIRDALTGLFNRRYLDETLPREIARAKRDGYSLTVIMVDIDHFKQVNDTRGHAAGDEVIRALGAILSESAREDDVACRYGGEEFVVAMPRMDPEAALARAEQWRRAAEEQGARFGGMEIRFTLSAGIASFPEHAATIDELLQCADRALYLSKHGGRNRVTRYQPQE